MAGLAGSDPLMAQKEGNPTPPRRHGVLYHWLWELLSVFVAFAALAFIAGILIAFDGEVVPEWRYSLTINAIVAILSTIARAAIAMVLAEIISQEKWSWFGERPRPLQHLQKYDHASRGLWGSFRLLGNLKFGVRGHGLAIIAALATILSVAVGPFSQQAVRTVLCGRELPDAQATLPLAPYIPGQDAYLYPSQEMRQVGSRVQAAMVSSLAEESRRAGNGTVTLRTSCATGNCTFPERHNVAHSTVGLCSKCVETTDLVDIPQARGYNTTIGKLTIRLNGSEVGHWHPWLAAGRSNFSETREPDGPPALAKLASNALANITILTATQAKCNGDECTGGEMTSGHAAYTENYGVLATSCVMYLCRKNVKAHIDNGRLVDYGPVDEDSHESYGEPLKYGGQTPYRDKDYNFIQNDWVSLKSPCLVNGTKHDVDASIKPENITRPTPDQPHWLFDNKKVPTQCVYGADWLYIEGLRRFVEGSLLTDSCTDNPMSNGTSVFCSKAWWLKNMYRGGNATFESVRDAFNTLSISTSNFWRNDGWGADQNKARIGSLPFGEINPEPEQFEMDATLVGVTNQVAVCVQLDWFWLLLPIGLALTTLALLALIIICNYRDKMQPVWKSDLLPLIFYGPSVPLDAPGAKASEDLNVLQRHARTIDAQFAHGDRVTRSGFVVPDGLRQRKVFEDQTETEMDTLLGERSKATVGVDRADRLRADRLRSDARVSIARKPVPTIST